MALVLYMIFPLNIIEMAASTPHWLLHDPGT